MSHNNHLIQSYSLTCRLYRLSINLQFVRVNACCRYMQFALFFINLIIKIIVLYVNLTNEMINRIISVCDCMSCRTLAAILFANIFMLRLFAIVDSIISKWNAVEHDFHSSYFPYWTCHRYFVPNNRSVLLLWLLPPLLISMCIDLKRSDLNPYINVSFIKQQRLSYAFRVNR